MASIESRGKRRTKVIAKTWWKEAVVYQVYPRSFMDSNGDGIGDLRGTIGKLDYIAELGADVIWLNPIYGSPNDDNGYDISDYRDIMTEFGTMADFDLLLAEAHKRGIRIVMDLVVNHTSDEHPWFIESRSDKDNPYRDYYIWREGVGNAPPNNWGASFQGSAWQKAGPDGMYYLHTFSIKQPDLNWENEKVRDEVYKIMEYWLDKGIDGFRMDVINYISKAKEMPDGPPMDNKFGDFRPYCLNGPRAHEFLREMNRKVLSRYDVMTVGETPGITMKDACSYAGQDSGELNMVFHFAHMGVDRGKYGKWSANRFQLDRLRRIMNEWQVGLDGVAWNSLYWNNHDQPRAVSRFGCDASKEKREASAKMLGTCLHMMQGTPYVYQGEELGMTNVAFPELSMYRDLESLNAYNHYVKNLGVNHDEMMGYIHGKGRDNARTPMQWSSGRNGGFSTGTPWIPMNPNYAEINAESQVGDPESVFSYYRKLIALRKKHDVIVYGRFIPLFEDDERVYAYERRLDNQRLVTLCNFSGDTSRAFDLEELALEKAVLLIGNYPEEAGSRFFLKPYEARVYLGN